MLHFLAANADDATAIPSSAPDLDMDLLPNLDLDLLRGHVLNCNVPAVLSILSTKTQEEAAGLVNASCCPVELYTPLYLAAQTNHVEMVRCLLSLCGAAVEPNRSDADGVSPLHIACYLGNLPLVKSLVETGGADVLQPSGIGSTPVLMAATSGSSGSLPVIKYLVEERLASLTTENSDGLTPIQACSSQGSLEALQYLVEDCGVAADGPDADGDTPLTNAAMAGHLDMVKYLVKDCQARVDWENGSGATPLFFAAMNGRIDVVKFLAVEGRADLNKTCPNPATGGFSTPYHIASLNRQHSVTDFLNRRTLSVPRLAVLAAVGRARSLEDETSTQGDEKISPLLLRLSLSPSDMVRAICEFLGEVGEDADDDEIRQVTDADRDHDDGGESGGEWDSDSDGEGDHDTWEEESERGESYEDDMVVDHVVR